MNSFFIKTKLKPIQKICISGLFIALLMILNKVVALNYIPVIPFVRLTIGSGALAIFASFALGPIYGATICVMADIFGYLFFDPKTMGFFPTITLIYLLLGIIPYFLFCLVNQLKNKKIMIGIEYILFSLLFLGVSLFFVFNNSLSLFGTTYEFEFYQKMIIIVVLGLLLLSTILINFIIDKKVKNDKNVFNVYQVSFVSFVTEILVFVIFGSLMKGIAFGFNMFLAIFISQIVVLFINVPINTYLILLTMRIGKRFII